MPELDSLLETIAGADGVKAVVVAGSDGLMIHGAQRGGQEDLDAIAAIASSMVGSLKSLAKEVGRSGLEQILADFGDGTILLQPIGADAALVVLSGSEANLGLLRFLVRRRSAEISHALEQL